MESIPLKARSRPETSRRPRPPRPSWAQGRTLAALTLLAAIAVACSAEDPSTSSSGTGGDGGAGGSTACEPGSKMHCYTGLLVSEGVGPCKGGERTCNADGSAFGICEGQVTPMPDDCATPEDEDCDGMPAPACAGSHLFSRAFGSALDEQGRAVAMDASGAMIATGFFDSQKDKPAIDFGGGALKGGGGRDLFLVKLDAAGAHVWSRGYGDDLNQEGASIAADASGNVLVTGSFDGALDFGGGKALASMGARDAFVIKLSSAGDVLWAKSYGDAAGAQQGTAIAADANGDVLVTGSFAGSMDLGKGLLTSAGGLDIFIAKLDGATGDAIWSERFGDLSDQSARGIAVDSAGNTAITGALKGTVDFGGGPVASAEADDVFVLKLDPAGAHIFSKGFGGPLDQAGQGVAVDAAGSVLVAGSFKGALDAGGGSLMSAGGDDMFIVKLDAAGAHQWSKRFGDPGSQLLYAIAADAAGNIVLTGKFDGSLDFGQKPALPSTEVYDIFTVKLDPSGAHVWSRAFGGKFDQIGLGVAIAKTGGVALTGTFFGSLSFGGDKLSSAGLSDLFIARFAP